LLLKVVPKTRLERTIVISPIGQKKNGRGERNAYASRNPRSSALISLARTVACGYAAASGELFNQTKRQTGRVGEFH
jgi:hypothetical protein